MRANKQDALPGTSIKNLIGQKFGKLTVTAFAGRDKHDYPLWDCVCDCGGKKTARSQELKRGDTTSCGCVHREIFRRITTTHGCAKEDWYMCWKSMVDRTTNPKAESYDWYKSRGIRIEDPRWLDPRNFFSDMGPRPSKTHSIDRMDNGKGYYKENCRWATKEEQGNNRSTCRMVALNGVSLTVSQWSKKTGIPRNIIYLRLDAGWGIDRALLTLVGEKEKPHTEEVQGFDGSGI